MPSGAKENLSSMERDGKNGSALDPKWQDHFGSQFTLSHPLSIEPASKRITAGSVSDRTDSLDRPVSASL
jgi:hypothetical protein